MSNEAYSQLLRNIFTPGGRASIPPLIAAKASSSLTGVDVQVILIRPCYGRARVVSRCGKVRPSGFETYCDFGDDNVRACATEFSRVMCHRMIASETALYGRAKHGFIYRKASCSGNGPGDV